MKTLELPAGYVYPTQSVKCSGCERIIRYNVTDKPIRTCRSCRTDNKVKHKVYGKTKRK